ncbi:MAG: hypothetical protein ACE5H3_05225 [Planctomycetota bacterium]
MNGTKTIETAPIELGGFVLSRELVRRKELNAFGLKMPGTVVYFNAWVIREKEAGRAGKIAAYALSEEDARKWVEEHGSGS